MEGQYYIRSIEDVVDELSTIEEENVFMVDDEAFINGKRMIALANSIRDAGIHKKYFTYCRIDTLLKNRQAIENWCDIGLDRLFVGIDAISATDLSAYNKDCSISQIEQGLAVAKEIGLSIFAQFVVNTNYTKNDFKALTRFIEHFDIEYPSFTVLTPLPGTDLLRTFDSITELQQNSRPRWELF